MPQQSGDSGIKVSEKTIKQLDQIINKINKIKNTTVTATVKIKDKISKTLNEVIKKINKLKNKTVTVTLKVKDKINKTLSEVTRKINKLKNKTVTAMLKVDDKISKKLGKITQNINKIKNKSATVAVNTKEKKSGSGKGSGKIKGFLKSGAGSVVSFAKESMSAAQGQAAAEARFANVLKLKSKATKGQIGSILKLTSVQQQNGVVSNEVQMAGAQQLATYAGNAKNIKSLIPAMNNLLVAQKGLNGTSDDAVEVANLMGQGLNGQTEGLKAAGMAFSEAEGNVIKYGTKEERAAMLAKIISNNVGEANAKIAGTDAGAIQRAQILFGDLKKQIGTMLLPYLAQFANWFSKNEPQIVNAIKKILNFVIGAVKKVFKFIGEHPEIIKFVQDLFLKITAFGDYLATVIPPILKKLSQWFSTTILPILKQIGDGLLNLWNNVILPFIKSAFPFIKQCVVDCFSAIGSVIEGGLKVLHGIIDFVTGVFTGDWGTAWQGVVEIFSGIFSGLAGILKAPLNAVIGFINEIIDKFNGFVKNHKEEIKFVEEFFGIKIREIEPIKSVGGTEKGEKQPNKNGQGNSGGSGNTQKKQNAKNALGTSYWKGGLTYINERGGEIVDLPNGSRVIPADKSQKMINSGGVSFGNIYITTKGVTTNEVVNEIVPKLKLALANL